MRCSCPVFAKAETLRASGPVCIYFTRQILFTKGKSQRGRPSERGSKDSASVRDRVSAQPFVPWLSPYRPPPIPLCVSGTPRICGGDSWRGTFPGSYRPEKAISTPPPDRWVCRASCKALLPLMAASELVGPPGRCTDSAGPGDSRRPGEATAALGNPSGPSAGVLDSLGLSCTHLAVPGHTPARTAPSWP